jgi:thymidylate synthase
MRSNDVVFGYRNDFAWQKHAAFKVIAALGNTYQLTLGVIRWQAASLHVYPRHYNLLRTLVTGLEAQEVTDGAV